ncbi:MAG: NAD(P)-binding protein [Oligoflexales bacterium]
MGKKVAVLGGGIGALTAALELAESGQNYDITVYQPGWRLGGKGASGRNMSEDMSCRIEEHGLHVWSGLYDNAFRVIRKCYGAMDRPKDAPLATWRDAFKESNQMVMWEDYKGKYSSWVLNTPQNGALPGEEDAQPLLSLSEYVNQIIKYLFSQALDCQKWKYEMSTRSFLSIVMWYVGSRALWFLSGIILFLMNILRHFRFVRGLTNMLLAVYKKSLWCVVKNKMDDEKVRRSWITVNFGCGNIRGMLKDDILGRGFDVINNQDYLDWVKQHLVDDGGLTANSPFGTFIYDAQFSYVGGDLKKPKFAAGYALMTIVRMALTFKGSLIWKMQAGMGDVVFTPLYEALKKKGVKFQFFYQARSLHLSSDKKNVESITIAKQAHLVSGLAEYQPLVDIKGLPCWPSTPLNDQIEERYPEDWDPDSLKIDYADTFQLKKGEDFDEIVLGIPVACLGDLCQELVQENQKWKDMTTKLVTVGTQALQLWFKKTGDEMDFVSQEQPITVTYHTSPLNTFADMSYLTKEEGWPARGEKYPQSLFYLCGPMRDDEDYKETAKHLCSNLMEPLLPSGVNPPKTPGAPLDWENLVDNQTPEAQGEKRLESQYLRGNTTPSQRFTLTLPNASKYRIKPGESGFANLFLAGDWTDNSFNVANIESTVMSGMLASNAMCGYPEKEKITGLNFGRADHKL